MDGEHQKTLLPNGIRLVSERIPHVRSVAVGVWVETGSRHEPLPKSGVSHFIEHLVFKGTETRTAEEVAKAVDSVGGQMDAFTTKEHTCFYVTVLDQHLPLAADLLSDILLHPLFGAEDIDRERSVVLQEFRMVEDTPDDLIHDLFAERVWAGHPLGRPILGDKSIILGLAREKILAYFVEEYSPARITIAAAGRLEHAQLVDLFGKSFVDFRRSGEYSVRKWCRIVSRSSACTTLRSPRIGRPSGCRGQTRSAKRSWITSSGVSSTIPNSWRTTVFSRSMSPASNRGWRRMSARRSVASGRCSSSTVT